MSEGKTHRQFAVDCFNETWTYLEKPDRTPEDDQKMIWLTYASLYHWSEAGTPVNLARGHWQVSRVWAVLGEGPNAVSHAKWCLDLCLKHGFVDWDLGFAYEAMARAHAVLGDAAGTERYLALAHEVAATVAHARERQLLLDDLATIVRA